jgi:PAS domain S-box-containing protein
MGLIGMGKRSKKAPGRERSRPRRIKPRRASETRSAAVLKTALDSIIIVDRQGRVEEWNPAAEQTFGYSRSQAIGRPAAELIIPPSLNQRQRRSLTRYLSGKGSALGRTIEISAARAGGGEFHAELAVIPVPDAVPPRFICFVHDITKRKRAQKALRQSEQRFALFMKHLPGAAFIKDADGRVVFVNEAHKHIMGWTGDEWKGKTSAELFPPDVAVQFEAHDRKVLETGKPLKVVEPIPHPDGYHEYLVSKFPIPTGVGGNPMLGGVAIDFTELRRAEITVRYHKTLLESLIEASLDGILLVSPEGRWLSFNRRFVEMWGIPTDIAGVGSDERALNAIHDKLKDPDEFMARVTALYGHPQEIAIDERIELKDGRIFSRNSSPVRSADGTYYGRVWFFHDNTEEERARDRLRSLASELTLSEERERRRVARVLHDDIAQLLAISEARLHRVARSGPDGGEVTAVIQILEEALQHTRSLTGELSPPILYEKGLGAAIEWLVERTRVRHGIDLSFSDDKQPKPLDEESAVLLFQATRELLANLVKHANATRGAVQFSRTADHLKIVVEDNGVGFDESTIQENQKKRDCFGLFNIRERLKYLDGRAEWESEPGRGARFTLTVPLREDRSSERTAENGDHA